MKAWMMRKGNKRLKSHKRFIELRWKMLFPM